MNTTFSRRRIDVTITLGAGQFGENLGDTMTLTGYRVQASIANTGGETGQQADVKIYGLPMETLNRLTMIGPQAFALGVKNGVRVDAGGDGSAMSMPFNGNTIPSLVDMSDAPNTCLNVHGLVGAVAALKPVGASSYVGAAQVSAIMADFAKEAGWGFENNAVNVTLSNPYFPGTTLDKIKACARAAGIFYTVENNATLAIWPADGARQQPSIPVISPDTGLIGYPSYSQNQVLVRCLLNPAVRLGHRFTIAGSQVTSANRTWVAHGIQHTVESQTPNGAWFTDIEGFWFDD